jgi:tRNA 2-thiouridine synthesizing protein C
MPTATAKKSILFVIQHAPYGSYATQETLDAALAAAAFEQQVQLLFSGDGVWSLVANQHSDAIQRKSIERLLHALHYYDIETVYVDADSLQARNLTAEHFSISTTALSADEQAALLRRADCVIAL